MHFDTNPLTLQEMNRVLGLDPRVIRHTFIKLGDKLEDIVEVKSDVLYDHKSLEL